MMMSSHKALWYAGILLLLALFLSGLVVAMPTQAVEPPAGPGLPPNVDPQIRAELATSPDHTTGFFVLFREKADLSPAYRIRDWDLRGRYVYDTLQATAERSQAGVRTWLQARGIAYRSFAVDNSLFLTAGESTLDALASFPEVAAFRANRTYPLAPAIPGPDRAPPEGIAWNIAQVHADQVWSEFGIKGQGIVVADIGTGVDYTHEALYVNYRCGAGPHDACWYDPTNACPGGVPCDHDGVSTFTMGTMAGDDNAALAYNVGMAPDAQWIACKACEGGACSEYNLTTCAEWIMSPGGDTANRPHVVNSPWGSTDAIPWFLPFMQAWRAAGIFSVFGAGETGPTCGSVTYPGDYSESFATGATDADDVIATWSGRGPSSWGEIKPEVSAPGVNVCSTLPGNSWSCAVSGTDMASPHAAGLVALLWSAEPALVGDLATTEHLVTSTAICRIDLSCGGAPCNNNVYGGGRLDAYNAVLAILCDPPQDLDFAWMPTVPAAGEVVSFYGTASGTMPIDFSWSFGDSSYGSGPDPTHTYGDPGDYTVIMTASNACGFSTLLQPLTVVPTCTSDLGPSYVQVNPDHAAPGEDQAYTIHVVNAGTCATTGLLSDTLPATLDFVPGSQWSSSGTVWWDAGARTLYWNGTVPAGGEVQAGFQATIGRVAAAGQPIVNTVRLEDQDMGQVFTRDGTTYVTTPFEGYDNSGKLQVDGCSSWECGWYECPVICDDAG